MHYYIDGYNLLFRILKTGDDLQKQREQLTVDLENKCSILDIDATLVFDSHYQEDESVLKHFKSLCIVFSGVGESADEYILQKLKETKNPSLHTVVTSDKKLALHCRLRLAKTEPVDEFLAWLNKRFKNKLKSKKEEASTPKILIQKLDSKPVPAKPPLPPPPCAGTFEFYLEKFEATSKLLVEEKNKKTEARTLKKKENSKRKNAKPKVIQEEAKISDMERWLKAFQNS